MSMLICFGYGDMNSDCVLRFWLVNTFPVV